MKIKLKILLTEISGGIGREVLKELCLSKEFEVTVFDIKTAYSQKRFSDFRQEIKIIYGDISNE